MDRPDYAVGDIVRLKDGCYGSWVWVEAKKRGIPTERLTVSDLYESKVNPGQWYIRFKEFERVLPQHNSGAIHDFAFVHRPSDYPQKPASTDLLGQTLKAVIEERASAIPKKAANPKKQYGDKKPPVHLIHMIAQLHESAALYSGKLKYGENNYLETPVEIMTYIGAIMRHCMQYASGERVDQKELVHHLGAIKACCTILLSAEACGMLIDNRMYLDIPEEQPRCDQKPRSYVEATGSAFREVETIVAHLNALYPPKA